MVSEIIAIFDVTVPASPEVDRMGDNKTIYITIYWSHCLAKQKTFEKECWSRVSRWRGRKYDSLKTPVCMGG